MSLPKSRDVVADASQVVHVVQQTMKNAIKNVEGQRSVAEYVPNLLSEPENLLRKYEMVVKTSNENQERKTG
eukprot:scaffold183281_cov55-Prasinocladus_malaysianus.AAC.1